MSTLPTRPLGRTGYDVAVLALGGVRHNELPDADCAAFVHRAIDLGINYIDTAHGYKDSERKIGLVMAERRDEVFLATKSGRRDRAGITAEIEESFRSLRTDRIDLYQLHGLTYYSEVAQLTGPDGALKAVEQYIRDGSIRFVGITGHSNPDVLVRALSEYPFDTVLCALGAMHAAVHPFHEKVVPAARERGAAVLAMKVMGSALFGPCADRAISFALSQEGVAAAVVGMDNVRQLERNVAIARAFRPMSREEQDDFLNAAGQIVEEDFDKAWFLRPEHTRGPLES